MQEGAGPRFKGRNCHPVLIQSDVCRTLSSVPNCPVSGKSKSETSRGFSLNCQAAVNSSFQTLLLRIRLFIFLLLYFVIRLKPFSIAFLSKIFFIILSTLHSLTGNNTGQHSLSNVSNLARDKSLKLLIPRQCTV